MAYSTVVKVKRDGVITHADATGFAGANVLSIAYEPGDFAFSAPKETRNNFLDRGRLVPSVRFGDDVHARVDAERFDHLSYHEVLMRDLKVMDQAAIALTRESGIPIVVFPIGRKGGIVGALSGESAYNEYDAHASHSKHVCS